MYFSVNTSYKDIMATVYIGHSAKDENGKYQNGQAGDQTGQEVCKATYYNHSQGWVGLRPKDEKVAELIAQCMEDACVNDCIGYDQNQRLTLYDTVKNLKFKCDINTLKVKVECDCSSLVRVCLAYAGVHVGNFNTASEKSVILGTGMFTEFTVSSDGSNLKRGDILVTKTKGHTVVVLSNGSKVSSSTTPSAPTTPIINNSTSTKTIGIAVAKTTMKVRSDANTSPSSATLGYVNKGASVEVIEVLSNGWYKIKYSKASCGYAYTSNAGGLYYTYTAKTTTTASATNPKPVTPTPTVAPTNSTVYCIQIGSFSVKSNGDRQLAEVKAKGCSDAFINAKNNTYKVQVGNFPNKSDADKRLAEMKKLGYTSAFITTK